MTSRMGMRVRSSREGVCGDNVLQFQFCDGSSYCTALGGNGCTDIVSPNCDIPVWSDDGAGNSLKTEPLCTTKTVPADRTW